MDLATLTASPEGLENGSSRGWRAAQVHEVTSWLTPVGKGMDDGEAGSVVVPREPLASWFCADATAPISRDGASRRVGFLCLAPTQASGGGWLQHAAP